MVWISFSLQFYRVRPSWRCAWPSDMWFGVLYFQWRIVVVHGEVGLFYPIFELICGFFICKFHLVFVELCTLYLDLVLPHIWSLLGTFEKWSKNGPKLRKSRWGKKFSNLVFFKIYIFHTENWARMNHYAYLIEFSRMNHANMNYKKWICKTNQT